MAERRMFAKTIIDSDAFIDMPMSARLLYYDLSMRADDDGFVNAPKKIMRFVGASNDDMNILIARKFVIAFDNGVVVIKHWRIHNYIRKDTYNETPYIEQKSMLELDEKNEYILKNDVSQLPVDDTSTQVRLGKVSIGKESINKTIKKKESVSDKHQYAEFVSMKEEEYQKLVDEYGEDITKKCIEKLDNYKGSSGKKYKSDYRAILSWVIDRVNENKPKHQETNEERLKRLCGD